MTVEWITAVERAQRITYRVRAGDETGTAFVASIGRPNGPDFRTLFVTAWHVVEGVLKNDRILDLTRFDGLVVGDVCTGPCEISPIGPRAWDLGVIQLVTRVPLADVSDMLPVVLETALPAGAEVGWLGYPGITAPGSCFFRGVVAGHRPDAPYYFLDGTALPGVSGGPVFDRNGLLVGVLAAYLPESAEGVSIPGLACAIAINPVRLFVEEVLRARTILRGRDG